MRILKGFGLFLALAFGALTIAGFYYLGSEPVPEATNFELSLAKLRAAAASLDGEQPSAVHFETIAAGSLPRGLSMAGEGFGAVEMPRPVFQVVFPDGGFLLIDVAYSRDQHEEVFAGQPYSDAAWDRLVEVMETARAIVVTHEHSDHLGGVTAHPRPHNLTGRLRLTPEQFENPRAVDTALPTNLLEGLEPLHYEDVMALAPGVALRKAPGHTPGSQIVFVRLAAGRELLFVGDVVWNLDAITRLKYRPRLITDFLLDEDREAVLGQIRALRNLHDEGQVSIVVSHDARTFATAGLLEGFIRSPLPRAE